MGNTGGISPTDDVVRSSRVPSSQAASESRASSSTVPTLINTSRLLYPTPASAVDTVRACLRRDAHPSEGALSLDDNYNDAATAICAALSSICRNNVSNSGCDLSGASMWSLSLTKADAQKPRSMATRSISIARSR